MAGGGWSCVAARDAWTCLHLPVTLAPGESLGLPLDVQLPRDARPDATFSNCAARLHPDLSDASFEPIRFVQTWLTAAGLDVGPIDNTMGSKTRAGISAFQRDAGLPENAEIDNALIEALLARFPVDANPENDRSCVDVRVVTQSPTNLACIGGELIDGKCDCPEKTQQRQVRDNVFACVGTSTATPRLTPETICEGGRVQDDGKCACPEAAELEQTGSDTFACVTVQTSDPVSPVESEPAAEPTPEISCEGGRVRDEKCDCPADTELKQTGNAEFLCVEAETPKPVEVSCEGGRVQDGKCACPEGTELNQSGDAAFQCIKTSAPDAAPAESELPKP